jgi:hypothetical protein
LRCMFILTFHNLRHSITISGNRPGQTQYMDSKQAEFPDFMMNITISGKSVRL